MDTVKRGVGRPRTRVPETPDERIRTSVTITKLERDLLVKMRDMHGLTAMGQVLRMCLRTQLGYLEAEGSRDAGADLVDTHKEHEGHALTVWWCEDDRIIVANLSKGYGLDKQVDVVRFCIQQEARRIGIKF